LVVGIFLAILGFLPPGFFGLALAFFGIKNLKYWPWLNGISFATDIIGDKIISDNLVSSYYRLSAIMSHR
jgi:hypothetical protein